MTILATDSEIARRHGSLAYLDGYADARACGRDGLWLPPHYTKGDRERYLMGFKQGLRVHSVLNAVIERQTAHEPKP